MSCHSRSSSEIETVTYKEVLPVFIEKFIKDFEFADVQHYPQITDLFTSNEYTSIVEEKNQKKQIVRLFWLLCAREHLISRFLDAIFYEYRWLVEEIKNERNTQSKITEQYIDTAKMLRSKNQKHTDYNVHRMESYMKLRNALKTLKPNHFVVLQGALGTGKKWLTQDVCCDYSVLKAMDFKIFYLDVQTCTSPDDDLRMLKRFQILLGETSIPTSDITEISIEIIKLQQSIRTKLRTAEFKNCLLVLQNVKNKRTWQTFNLGCKMLLITRNKDIRKSFSVDFHRHLIIESDLKLAEFYELFEKYTGTSRRDFPTDVTDIYYNSNGHPYLLSIIGQSIRSNRNNWNVWINNLLKLQISNNKFTDVINRSFKVLQPEQLKLYTTLSIFPHSIAIPIRLLATLWNKTLPEAEDIVNTFDKHSLVDKNVEKQTCILPFIYVLYLNSSTNMQNAELHKKVVDYYDIENALKYATEVNFFKNNYNEHFFHCIGHHLHNAECIDLFSKLYFNFGFLEQKIRTIGLLKVLTYLKYYENDIIDNVPERLNMLLELREFLPKVEEKLMHSNDTCLLQYALLANGNIYEQAIRQIEQFPNNVWFTEKGNFHQRRQIVTLPNTPKIVHLLEYDICLIVLDDDNMLLIDISLDSNKSIVTFENENTKCAELIEARFIRDDNYILTLDKRGQLKLWSIKDDRRRSLVDNKTCEQKVHPLNINLNSKQDLRKCKQSIHEIHTAKRGKIVAFDVEQQPEKYDKETRLHVAFDNGDVCVFKFNPETEEFQHEKVPTLQTRAQNIRIICKLLTNYYMLLNVSGHLKIWNLRDSSEVLKSFEWPVQKSSFICYELLRCEQRKFTCIIFVFGNQVLSLVFKQQSLSIPDGVVSVIYETNEAQNAITCAKVSPDGCYLVLGTKYGIVVIDMNTNAEILRSNVSEAITCVDIIHVKRDIVYKYIITCGVKQKNILYLFALRHTSNGSIGWAHNVSHLSNEASNDPQLEPGVWLWGRKLYDIAYGDYTHLIAADSKNRIHKVSTTNSKNWSIVKPVETKHQITAITTYHGNSFIGYSNGAIFNLNDEMCENEFTTDPITYLQLVDKQILVASSADKPKTQITNLVDKVKQTLSVDTKYCFKLFHKYLVLINECGIVTILDINQKFSIIQKIYNNFDILGGCDLKNSVLFMATKCYNIHTFYFLDDEQLKISSAPSFEKNEKITNDDYITCLTASNDASLIAVGQQCGNIEVYKLVGSCKLQFVYLLQSHAKQIFDMKFSPNAEVLVSCADQLCFWSIKFIINNPVETNRRKSSSTRFISQNGYEEVDAKVVKPNSFYLQVAGGGLSMPTIDANYDDREADAEAKEICDMAWRNKRGPNNKPELLSCIKFDGNQAEKISANKQFTQFNTIDDEGVYYHLQLFQHSHNGAQHNMEDYPDVIVIGNGYENGNGNGNGIIDYHEPLSYELSVPAAAAGDIDDGVDAIDINKYDYSKCGTSNGTCVKR